MDVSLKDISQQKRVSEEKQFHRCFTLKKVLTLAAISAVSDALIVLFLKNVNKALQ